ncbi:unnamed protein product [Trichobilharzia regenti]|nr:unnamed protein product [Trichobilharzia regenti]
MAGSGSPPGETKFIYYIDEEETPYLVKLNIAPDKVTLGDFKNALNRPHSKFFFKSIDDDFGRGRCESCINSSIIKYIPQLSKRRLGIITVYLVKWGCSSSGATRCSFMLRDNSPHDYIARQHHFIETCFNQMKPDMHLSFV